MMKLQTITTREMLRHYTRAVAQVHTTGQPLIILNKKAFQVALITLDDLQTLRRAKERESTTALLRLAGSIPAGSGLPKDLAENHSAYAWD